MPGSSSMRDSLAAAGISGRSSIVLGAAALAVLLVVALCLSWFSLRIDQRREAAIRALGRDVQGQFRQQAEMTRVYALRLAEDTVIQDALAGLPNGGELTAERRTLLLDRLTRAGMTSELVLAVHDDHGRPLAYRDGRGNLPASGFFVSGEASAGLEGRHYATPLKRESLRLGPFGMPAWRAIDTEYCLMQAAPVNLGRQRVGFTSVLACGLPESIRIAAGPDAAVGLRWWPALPGAETGGSSDLPATRLLDAADLLGPPESGVGSPFRIGDRIELALRLPGDVAGPEYLIVSASAASPQIRFGELSAAVLLAAIVAALLTVPFCVWSVDRRLTRPLARLRAAVLALRQGDYAIVRRQADEEEDTDAPPAAELWRLGDLAAHLARREDELRLWNSVFTRSREAIFICSPDGTLQYVNPALLAATGRSEAELLGRPPSFLSAGLHDDSFYVTFWQTLGQSGQWQGEVWDRRADGSSYPMRLSMSAVYDANGEVAHYVGLSHDISERKAHEAQIQYLVHFDALTHLPNRGLLRDRLEVALAHAAREDGQVALLFIDLDRFKLINDTLGHAVGDGLLKEVAERLKRAVRASDTVCRLGADEFIVLLDRLHSVHDAELVAEHIIAVLAPAVVIQDHDLSITPSIGISLFPQDASDPDELIRKADVAMYHAKSLGRNNYQVFRSTMTEQAVESLSLEQQLRLAVDRDEFILYFQPQVEIETRRVTGVEALVRWRSPELGLVPPGKFIPLAEECGLIQQIGDWVMREACRQRAEWTRMGLPAFPVAVNVSALQFRQADFGRRVREAMSLFGVPPEALELELTESIVMQEDGGATRTLAELRQIGVGLAVDDFGTGYSSLSYLKRLPIRKLKIDGSFVRGVESKGPDRAIVQAIVSMALALDLDLVAEGVENTGCLGEIAAMGCRMAQGFFYCQPLPAADFIVWLEEFSARSETV